MTPRELPESVAAILVDNAAPTPPLDDFLIAYNAESNLWWRIGCGHHQNLLEEAVERLEALQVALSNETRRANDRKAERDAARAENERLRWALGKGLTESEAADFLATREHMMRWANGEESHPGEDVSSQPEDQP